MLLESFLRGMDSADIDVFLCDSRLNTSGAFSGVALSLTYLTAYRRYQ